MKGMQLPNNKIQKVCFLQIEEKEKIIFYTENQKFTPLPHIFFHLASHITNKPICKIVRD